MRLRWCSRIAASPMPSSRRSVNRLANYLRGLGVGPETVVGLCVERSPEMVIGFWGILTAGGVCLPLDPSYPQDRLGFMLRDAGAGVLVTQSGVLRAASRRAIKASTEDLSDLHRLGLAAPGHIVRLDADWPQIARQAASAPAVPPRPPQRCICHLYVRINRNAQSSRRRARKPC